jgi:hypothetical protein
VRDDERITLKLTGLPPGAGWVLAFEVAGYIAGAIETGLTTITKRDVSKEQGVEKSW